MNITEEMVFEKPTHTQSLLDLEEPLLGKDVKDSFSKKGGILIVY